MISNSGRILFPSVRPLFPYQFVMKYAFFLLLFSVIAAGCGNLSHASQQSTPAAPLAASVTAALLAANRTAPTAPPPALMPVAKGGLRLEADKAVLTGNTLQTKTPGYSGTGYVGDFDAPNAKMVWTVPNVKAGIYDVTIRYSSPFGAKGYVLAVNGSQSSGTLTSTGNDFALQNAGKVSLKAGSSTVEVDRGWGYYYIDAVDLTPAAGAGALPKLTAALSDPQATPAARALMAQLVKLYGQKTLSGQYNAPDTQAIVAATSKTPAIMGGDLIEYSPSRIAHGSDPKNETERLIAAAKAGQVVTLSWHWNAPTDLLDRMGTDKSGKPEDQRWYKGFNADATTFDVQKALADPNSADYKLLLSDIDAIAVQLQKLQAAGVPVLWRPLHEAEGGWFWWGAHGPDAFKQLWALLYDRLTNFHHLHNLIWVYSDTEGLNPAWYPGDDKVDIVGVDSYPSDVGDPLSSDWDTMFKQHGPKKLLALTEFGGVPDVDKMRQYGVRWSYFVTWTGFLSKTPPAVVKRVYNSASVGTESLTKVSRTH